MTSYLRAHIEDKTMHFQADNSVTIEISQCNLKYFIMLNTIARRVRTNIKCSKTYSILINAFISSLHYRLYNGCKKHYQVGFKRTIIILVGSLHDLQHDKCSHKIFYLNFDLLQFYTNINIKNFGTPLALIHEEVPLLKRNRMQIFRTIDYLIIF